ncbi:MAG: ATP-binding cassette domain-containing protein [Actinobacteria bacterium]|nr:ATP-binding cassette domain-containing protein [Actinomycetota bacterium]
MNSAPLLAVKDLSVSFTTPDGVVHAVNDVSFELFAGKTLGIVGESGSGKSVTASSLMRLNNSVTSTTTGSVELDGRDLLSVDEPTMRSIRGQDIAMVFQDPLSALNPYYTVGDQIAEAYVIHHPTESKKDIRLRVLDMLTKVGIPNPAKRIDEYPHQFSGGMRQRIVIAIALINSPRILIADEPTTALDVTVQAQILDLMLDLQRETNMAIILITHDLGVIAEVADSTLVMYGGRIVERATVNEIFSTPTHPYSWGLLGAVGSLDTSTRGHLSTIPGTPPSLISLPSGCSFHPRCHYAKEMGSRCITEVPQLHVVTGTGSSSACHMADAQLVALARHRENQ